MIRTNIRKPIKLAQFIGRAQRVMSGETNDVADVPNWTYLSSRKIMSTLSRSDSFLQQG